MDINTKECPFDITEDAAIYVKNKIEESSDNNSLRVIIDSGGCAGFSANFKLESTLNKDDIEFDLKGAKIVTDNATLSLMDKCVIEYSNNLMGSYLWLNVPHATSTCGCGTSFSM